MAAIGKFEALATLVAGGRTVAGAADELGLSRRSAYRNSKRPAFQARVSAIRAEITSAAVGKLSQSANQAVATLVELLDADFEPSTRLNAAKAILTSLGPISELSELRERIARLEGREGAMS